MEKGIKLTLVDVGDAAFRVLQRYLFRRGTDPGAEVTVTSSDMQESLFVRLADSSTILTKIFPHKNFLEEGVYRIEVFRTKPGDLRGNRVAFVEIPKGTDAVEEIRLFIEGVLSQSDL
ncbi:MAG: hypothetical protein GX442_17885 [Candidatus Riflebacteria bacterium]|nr:hypothetical protein [Candidatus Riflebacteria bacterium]